MTEDVEKAIAGCRDATARLLAALEAIEGLDTRQPSLLPDWSIGHVLTHLARSADSYVRILRGAAEGLEVAQYPEGASGRSRDIEQGSARPAAAIVDDLRTASAALARAWDEAPAVAWQGWGVRLDGSPFPCRRLPVSRWREVEVHHVDLGLGYGISDWPESFVTLDLPLALERLPQRIGSSSDRAALLAWAYGRAGEPTGIELQPF